MRALRNMSGFNRLPSEKQVEEIRWLNEGLGLLRDRNEARKRYYKSSGVTPPGYAKLAPSGHGHGGPPPGQEVEPAARALSETQFHSVAPRATQPVDLKSTQVD